MNVIKRTMLSVIALLFSMSFVMGMLPQGNSKIAVETVVLSPGNTAPIAENLEFSTYRNTQITGKLSAFDAENEQIFFEITKQPKSGKVTLYDDGSFDFDPCGTKRTKVTFAYVAVDKSGNRSDEANVTINIEKRNTEIVYKDINKTDEYAAVYLAENGIYTGECLGEDYFFRPERTVTNTEFLSMCLTASKHEFFTSVTRTGLENDESIPTWAKNCISTALVCGCFIGDETFVYDENITYESAAVMINEVFEITDVVTVSAITPYLRETSAQAVNNLYKCGIADEDIVSKFDEALTMADAAKLIAAATEIHNNR